MLVDLPTGAPGALAGLGVPTQVAVLAAVAAGPRTQVLAARLRPKPLNRVKNQFRTIRTWSLKSVKIWVFLDTL